MSKNLNIINKEVSRSGDLKKSPYLKEGYENFDKIDIPNLIWEVDEYLKMQNKTYPPNLQFLMRDFAEYHILKSKKLDEALNKLESIIRKVCVIDICNFKFYEESSGKQFADFVISGIDEADWREMVVIPILNEALVMIITHNCENIDCTISPFWAEVILEIFGDRDRMDKLNEFWRELSINKLFLVSNIAVNFKKNDKALSIYQDAIDLTVDLYRVGVITKDTTEMRFIDGFAILARMCRMRSFHELEQRLNLIVPDHNLSEALERTKYVAYSKLNCEAMAD